MIPTTCLFTPYGVKFLENASVQSMLSYACQTGDGMIPSPPLQKRAHDKSARAFETVRVLDALHREIEMMG